MAALFAACGANSGAPNSTPLPTVAQPESSATHTFPLRIAANKAGGTRLIIDVSIAGGPAVPLLFDTGAVGVHVFDDAVGTADLHETDRKHTTTFGSGTRFLGVTATAPMTVSGIPTSGPIAFELVRDLECTDSRLKCSGRNGFSSYVADQGVRGIFGAGLSDGDIYSPLLQLAGGYPRSYTVSVGTTQASVEFNRSPTNVAASFPIPASDQPMHPNGAPAWSDRQIRGCWAFNKEQRKCVTTVFDTGATNTSTDTTVPGAPLTTVAPRGTVLTLATTAAAKPIWTTVSGVNQIGIHSHVSSAAVNSGIALFKAFDVTFDVAQGTLALSSH